MKKNIFEEITNHFELNDKIPLTRLDHYDTYIGISTTKINGIQYQSITYKISEKNSKRITKNFLKTICIIY